MIKDTLDNAHNYDHLHKNFRMVFEILQSLNFDALEEGHIELDGDYVYINVDTAKRRKANEARLEAHKRYIDIQIPFDEPETIGVANIATLAKPDGEFDTEHDIIFYNDPIKETITVDKGEFAIFFPEDAHAPNIDCPERHRKLVAKISVKPNEEKPVL